MREAEIEAVLEIAKRLDALLFDEFQLSAGGTSRYYFDGRLVTLDPEGAYRVAKAILPIVWSCGAGIVAGPAVAAVPIVASIVILSFMEKRPVSGLIVRSEPKKHGAKRGIEGGFKKGDKVVVVDDTCSTGGNLLHSISALEAAGCSVSKVVCILDRNGGGSDAIRSKGIPFESLLEADLDGTIVVSRH
jgi:orotate phosphoribosyltransferase